jgi:hypothetical protein
VKARATLRALLACALWTATAFAEIVRHAVVIGNNLGNPTEAALRFAEADARKVQAVLQELGEFPPENVTLLAGRSAADAQRALISVNARIRSDTSAGRDAVLFVYYSGHADAESLHLGATPLELPLLERLVQGSPAAFRILVLDACRSGALTRVKGGFSVPPFAVTLTAPIASEGLALLTSSAANEDAQESDALRGSFFTHYFVSGLRGAADRNQDGAVSLEEVYGYAYQHTLSASSQTLHGTQHPTFRLDLKGHGAVPLTWLWRGAQSARLTLPAGRSFLIFSQSEHGPVVAEVGENDDARTLALDAGSYFVRARARDHLLEGRVQVASGLEHRLDPETLERVEYARLARKGGTQRVHAHGPSFGYLVRTPLWERASLCQGVRAGYGLDLSAITWNLAAAYCRSTFENTRLRAHADELRLDASALHVIDVQHVSISLGGALGAGALRQSFTTRGRAPSRSSWIVFPAAVAGLSADLGAGFSLFLESLARLAIFQAQRDDGQATTTAVPGLELTLGAGKRF